MHATPAHRGPPPRRRTPRWRDDVVFRPLGDDFALYDPASQRLHVLNLTAALVWSYCDGLNDADGIARGVADAYGHIPPGCDLLTQIEQVLSRFRDEGLLH